MFLKLQNKMSYVLYQEMINDKVLKINCADTFKIWHDPFQAKTVSPYTLYALLTGHYVSEEDKVIRLNRIFFILWNQVGGDDVYLDIMPQVDKLTYAPNYQMCLVQSFASLAHKPEVAIDMWRILSRITLAENPIEELNDGDFQASKGWYRVNRDVFTILLCKFAHEGFYMLSKINRNSLIWKSRSITTIEDYKDLCC